MATSSLYGSVSESTGLYGIGAASGGTYFEWFIFYDSATAPATPTGGSWDFNANTGTTPTGWLLAPPAAPTNLVWVSIAIVDSRSTSSLVWSTPGLMTGSGLPILTGSGAPSSGTGLNGQLYINTSTTPQSMYNKQSGAWVQLTGATVYATAGANTNITSLTGITGGISSPTFLQINTAGDGVMAAGKLQWDPTFGGPTIGMAGGNVNQNIGQDGFVYVYNNTGSTINKGQVVYVSGSQGQRLTVALAQANADSTSLSVLGFAAESIANNASGFVANVGLVQNINTSGFADGTAIWLSPTVAGGFTTTKPVAPNHLVLLGYVVKGGSVGAGSIYVFTQNGYELDELHDVLITNVQNGNYLKYNSSIPAWVNVAGPTGTLVGTTDTQTLTNKTISGASNTLTNIGNSSLTNSSVTINGNAVSLGGSTTVTAATPNNLTFGTGLSASSSFNGSTPTSVSLQAVGTAGTYGNSGQTPILTVNSVGQVTNITLQNVTVDTTDITGTIAIAQGGTGASTAGGAMQNLLPSYLGNNGKLLALNAGGTALEWKAVSGVGTVTSIDVSGGTTGLTTYGGPITAAGTITLAGTLNVANGGTGATTAADAATNLGLGTGNSPTFTGLTLSGGTANGVPYLNASKVLTTGSVLTFQAESLLNTQASGTNSYFRAKSGTVDVISGAATTGLATGAVYGTFSNHNVIFYQNSAEQMRLTSTGLGIGTSSPAKLLDVSSASSPTIRITNTTDWASSSTGLVGALEFYTTDPSTPGARVLSYIQSYNNAGSSVPEGNLYFGTALGGGSGAAATTKMVLDSSGNLGIGTTSPGYKLDVIGTARIQSSSGYNFFFQTSGTTARINYLNDAFSANISAAYRATDFVWQKGDGSDVLKLDSSGNLGLGVTPSAWLSTQKAIDISSYGAVAASSNGAIRVVQNAYLNSAGNWIYKNTSAASFYEQDAGIHAWKTASSGVANSTSVTSGVTYVVYALGSSTLAQWQALFSGLAALPTVGQTITATATGTLAGGGTVSQTITFTQAMTLNASGNLGIGTSSPGARLVVAGGSAYVTNTAGNAAGIELAGNGNGAASTSLFIGQGSDGTGYVYQRANLGLLFGTNNTERMRLDSSGNLGLGVTPSAWGFGGNLELAATNNIAFQGSGNMLFNAYYSVSSGGYLYKTSAAAARYQATNGGQHQWFNAASGTANTTTITNGVSYTIITSGNQTAFGAANNNVGTVFTATSSGTLSSGTVSQNISFTQAMTLDASGNLGIGTTSPRGKLDVNGDIYGAASTLNVVAQQTGGSDNGTLILKAGGGVDPTVGTNITLTGYTGGTNIKFNTANTTRMTLDSSGNLGLGVTPSAGWSSRKAFQIGAVGSLVQLGAGNYNTTVGNNWYVDAGGTSKYIQAGAASIYDQGAGAHAWFTAASGAANGTISFTQAMTLDASGQLQVGGTTNGTGFQIVRDGTYLGWYTRTNHPTNTPSGYGYADFLYNSSTIGSITQSGTTAVLYNVTSDQRLKENIQDAESASALIDALQVRKYDWKSDGSHQRYGFVAQELVTVAPEAVHQPEDPEEMMAVDYSKLVPMLVKELQSLRARVAQLESK